MVAIGALTTPSASAPGRGARPVARLAATPEEPGYRAKAGQVDLYLPPGFHPVDGRYDLVVHFHGTARAQEVNAAAAKLNAAVVSVNLGAKPSKYGATFRDPRAFDALLGKAERLVASSGRAEGAKLARIALSAWSAGFGAVGAILKQDEHRSRIDAVLLADGLHAPYSDLQHHVIAEQSLAKYAQLSEDAVRGDKLFVLTHSSIATSGYASVAESTDTILRLAAIPKGPPPASAPRQMRATYQVNRGDLHVTGFEGHGVSDHIDHLRAMGQTSFPFLAARWDRAGDSARD